MLCNYHNAQSTCSIEKAVQDPSCFENIPANHRGQGMKRNSGIKYSTTNCWCAPTIEKTLTTWDDTGAWSGDAFLFLPLILSQFSLHTSSSLWHILGNHLTCLNHCMIKVTCTNLQTINCQSFYPFQCQFASLLMYSENTSCKPFLWGWVTTEGKEDNKIEKRLGRAWNQTGSGGEEV